MAEIVINRVETEPIEPEPGHAGVGIEKLDRIECADLHDATALKPVPL